MRIPLTKYGWPQVVIFPAAVLTVMALVIGNWLLVINIYHLPVTSYQLVVIVSIEALLAIFLIWVLAFFRDPYRAVPADTNLLLAPADGKITDIEIVCQGASLSGDENDFIGAKALRIGIFLSIFDAHINRAPCNVKVEKITYKHGQYKNAKNPQSGRVNESNELALVRTDSPKERLIVRQISGAIARRIVCQTSEGQKLTGGEKFGMIKFGSRTELILKLQTENLKLETSNFKLLVKVGDKVKAGLTPLVRYE